MQFTPMNSSNIKAIAHDGEDLYINFHKGDKVFVYRMVSEGTYYEMLEAESVGKFFHSRIKDQYVTSEVTDKSNLF